MFVAVCLHFHFAGFEIEDIKPFRSSIDPAIRRPPYFDAVGAFGESFFNASAFDDLFSGGEVLNHRFNIAIDAIFVDIVAVRVGLEGWRRRDVGIWKRRF